MVNITSDTTISYPIPIIFPSQRVGRELGTLGQYGGFIQFSLSHKDHAAHKAFLLPMKKSAQWHLVYFDLAVHLVEEIIIAF